MNEPKIGDRMREAANVLFKLGAKSTPWPWVAAGWGTNVTNSTRDLIVANAPREATSSYIATLHPGVTMHIVEAMERMAERATEISEDYGDPYVAEVVAVSSIPGWEAMSRAVDEILGDKP